MRGTAARTRACPAATLKRKASSRKRGEVSRSGRGMVPAHVVHHDVEPAELAPGPLGQRGHELVVGEVARNHHGPPARLLDLLGHAAQLGFGAGGQHDVRTGLGQGDGGGGTDAAPAGGDDGDVVGDEEAIEDHPRNIVVRPDPGSRRQVRPGLRRRRPAPGRACTGPSPSKVVSMSTALSTALGWKAAVKVFIAGTTKPKPTPRKAVATSRRPSGGSLCRGTKRAGDEQGHGDQIGDVPGEVHALEAGALGECPSQQ